MFNISNRTKFNSDSEASSKTGDIEFSFDEPHEELKILIQNANEVDLKEVFKYYKLNLNEINKKIICPFKFHKNGRESTPSFYFYPQNNAFYCFGCKSSRFAVDFVSLYEHISKKEAAKKIINIFCNGKINSEYIKEEDNYVDKIEYIIQLSNISRDLLKNKNLNEVEKILQSFDSIYEKYDLSNEALEVLTEQIIIQLKDLEDNG